MARKNFKTNNALYGCSTVRLPYTMNRCKSCETIEGKVPAPGNQGLIVLTLPVKAAENRSRRFAGDES